MPVGVSATMAVIWLNKRRKKKFRNESLLCPGLLLKASVMCEKLKGAGIPGWTLSPSGNGLHVGEARLSVLPGNSSAVPLKRPFNSLSFSEGYKKCLCMLTVALYILTVTCSCNFCIPTEEVLNPAFYWFKLN